MAYKLYALNYPLAGLIPVTSYTVDINMEVDGHGEAIQIRTYLPQNDNRQTITGEVNSSGTLLFSLQNEGGNRVGTWSGENVEGSHALRYTFDVQGRHVRYRIPKALPIPSSYPAEILPYLQDEPGINKEDPLIGAELKKIMPPETPLLLDAVTRIHRHLQDNFKNRNFSGFTDSLTALKLGEASCNGKSRLFLAMARRINIPARLVGGFIMNPGAKRTSHQWVEVYANGHWVPFDTINDHFSEIPANFLTLYYGDLGLFKHTTNINFQYHFKTVKKVVPRKEVQSALGSSAFNTLNLYSLFERIGIPQNLLKIILMIPLGALVTVIFRNVIGLETFGTFLPALIASAARDTGLLWGLIGFMAIIVSCAAVRKALDWMELLHSPKMAILLTTVVMVMLGMTTLGVSVGLFDLAHITLFPIAILAITAERFALIETEQGFGKALKITLATLVVIAAAYVVMNSLFLQSLILAFPELLLVVMAINLWLGKWIGLRVVEFIRFR
ncbi:MAG: UUP1 family membrane protein, partial [Deltaproteobacteria bacterium]|nr:UUP1 family membrane protein [Deltaproteobacteria bacterium]